MTATTPSSAALHVASLRELLDARASAADIASYLDALGEAERIAAVGAVKGSGVKRLYEAVASTAPLTLEDFVPLGEKGTRIFQGRNSLPTFSSFQKRFTRLESGQIIGYNHQSMAFVTGPGYFAVKPPEKTGENAGELYFDYTEAPSSEPAGWPAFKPNEAGLSRFVYGNMKDYIRRVARGVVVGKAYRHGIAQNAYFSLTLAS